LVWAHHRVRKFVRDKLPYAQVNSSNEVHDDIAALIVVGGGSMIDLAKDLRYERGNNIVLVAIPTVWGSGAENSPVVVLERDGEKWIRMDSGFLPDYRVVWRELMPFAPEKLLIYGCGDVWAHALEGMLSPLATRELQAEIANLIRRMLEVELNLDGEWYELSAQACAAQAQSSVGLIHGIAHVLEPMLPENDDGEKLGHARLCSTLLYPIMSYNRQASGKLEHTFQENGLAVEPIFTVLQELFESSDYDFILPFVHDNWKIILRNPSSRANSALVRQNSLDFFVEKRF